MFSRAWNLVCRARVMTVPALWLQHPCLTSGSRHFASLSTAPAAADIRGDNKLSQRRDSLLRTLETAVEAKDIDHAWRAFRKLKKIDAQIPDKTVLRDFLAQLAAKDEDVMCLFRAHWLLSYLKEDRQIEHLDASLLGQLGMAFAKTNMIDLSVTPLRIMLHHHHYPSLAWWKTLMQYWVQKPFGAVYVIKILREICKYLTNRPVDVDPRYEQTKPDAEAFNIALKACALLKQTGKAESIFALMKRFGCQPNNDAFASLIKAYEVKKIFSLQKMKKLLSRMKHAGVVPNATTLNALVMVCLNLDELDGAGRILLSWSQKADYAGRPSARADAVLIKDPPFLKMLSVHKLICKWATDMKNLDLKRPPAESYSLLIGGFLKHGRVNDAASFLQHLCHVESNVLPCGFVLGDVIKAGLRDEVHSVLKVLETRNTPPDHNSYGMLVDAYCKVPQPIKAKAVLDSARKAGCNLDAGCYLSLIDAYVLLQDYETACLSFQMMKQDEIAPLEPTFKKLFTVFEKHRQANTMFKLLAIASEDTSLPVDLHLCNRTLRVFGKTKQMVEAEKFLNWMQQRKIDPDTTTYNYMLTGYIFCGRMVDSILLLWNEVKQSLVGRAITFNDALASGFLTEFVKSEHFVQALEVIEHVNQRNIWIDKEKYKNMYRYSLKNHKHNSNGAETQMEQEDAFKQWVGL